MVNISKGGVGILYPVSTELGTQLKIQFSIPTNKGVVPITTSVTVCHVHFANNSFHIGLEFYDMDIPDKLIIASFIQTKIAQNSNAEKVVLANNKH